MPTHAKCERVVNTFGHETQFPPRYQCRTPRTTQVFTHDDTSVSERMPNDEIYRNAARQIKADKGPYTTYMGMTPAAQPDPDGCPDLIEHCPHLLQ